MPVKYATLLAGVSLWLGSLLTSEALGQGSTKVYVIMAVDAKNFGGNASDAIELDRKSITSLFVSSVPKSDLEIINIAEGVEISGKAILDTVDSVNVDSNDTIIFYYSGHGAVDDDQGRFLQLSGSAELLRSKLIEAMKKKSARLKILLTDCCAAEVDLPEAESSAPKLKPATEWTKLASDLFREPEGFIDISSSTRPELSWISKTGEGSVFTLELTELFTEHTNLGKLSWKEFFQLLKEGTVERSTNERGESKKQTPELITLELGNNSEKRRVGVDVQRNPNGGVTVVKVVEGLPAAEAGLEPGDVILTWNEAEIRDAKHFGQLVDESKGKVEIRVVNVKDGKEYVVELDL
jgi:uncharacterized caspase-like protein